MLVVGDFTRCPLRGAGNDPSPLGTRCLPFQVPAVVLNRRWRPETLPAWDALMWAAGQAILAFETERYST